MLKNIALIKPISQQFFERIHREIESITPETPVRRAEVGLLVMTELQQVIPGELRHKSTEDNPYFVLVRNLFSKEFLSHNNHLTTNIFFETMVRYGDYFNTNEQFFTYSIE